MKLNLNFINFSYKVRNTKN